MAFSDVNICNMALLQLGKERIISLSDSNARAEACSEFYEATRDSLIRAFPWDFAKVRATLSPLSTAPEWGYGYKYLLPPSPKCLRVLTVNGDRDAGVTWRREGKYLLTDEDTVQLLYLGQITDPTLFDPLFYQLLAKRMAAEMAYTLTKSQPKADGALALYEAAEIEAFNAGSMESSLDDVDEANDLIDARL